MTTVIHQFAPPGLEDVETGTRLLGILEDSREGKPFRHDHDRVNQLVRLQARLLQVLAISGL